MTIGTLAQADLRTRDAVLQQLEVALHPVYFDHNAVYHAVQAAALVVLYLGFRRVADSAGERRLAGV